MKWKKVRHDKWQAEDGKTIYKIRRQGRGYGWGGKRTVIQYYQYKAQKCRTLGEAKKLAEC